MNANAMGAFALTLGAFATHYVVAEDDDTYEELPSVVLNEVLFDPTGAAGSEGAWQFVEVYANEDTALGNLELRNASGTKICRLPDLDIAAGDHLVVLLGVVDPELDNLDASAGPLVMTHGTAFGDYVGVASGGVQLTREGVLLDAVYWGSTPSGSPFVNVSFAGGKPISEGDSIGRDWVSSYTGTAADWTICGGANANGTTPGVPNIVEIPSTADFVLYQDLVLNSLLAGLSRSEQSSGWLQVTNTAPSIATVSNVGNAMTVGVDHVLDVTVHGQPMQLAGRVTTTFTRNTTALATGESWSTSGQIATAGGAYSLQLSAQRSSSGAHALEQLVNSGTSYAWKHNGLARNVAVNAVRRNKRVSATTWTGSDERAGTDWGSADGKTGSTHWTKTKLGDGAYELAASTARSAPTLLAHPLHVNSNSSDDGETIEETMVITIDGLGLTSGEITQFKQTLGGVAVATLRDGEVGTFGASITPTTGGQTFQFLSNYPVYDQFGTPRDLTLDGSGTTSIASGKETSLGSLVLTGWPGPASTLSFAIDPPLQNPPAERSTGGKVADFVVTTATCVGGGVAGQIVANGAAGGKAIGQMVGKAAAKKLIPFVGWFCTAVCLIKAVGDQL